MKWRNIYELLEVEEQNGELSANEQRRLRVFKERKAKVDAMPEQPCKVCGEMVPIPMIYCSSKCKEADKEPDIDDEEERELAKLGEKAIQRKAKGRRTDKGTFHGKSRGKYRERLPV